MYNGWKNYETWAVSLWLGNDEGTYNLTREMADECKVEAPEKFAGHDGPAWTDDETARYTLAERLEELVTDEDIMPDLGATMYSDLLNAALASVDWDEIAANILSES